ncbi:MAG: hypothetical protein A3J93_01315 [Candidatus Magasanikbacteria bacterium RIFOXYC2_FULL_42_28]|uniref:Transglycosylase SLT domain-containing protein n=1 Tax=Candidatus Magasanikbacteria bacterium RIFOXYC2_FULL_42_28 TaxID=1798704 RepID=A0A1F6NXW4_9BACT|nr:MAG: hypothetical protein A3J93_01315 [Candidatus Magasanikbacteria bacterium RIFOXYC2_FULL_42_28]
MEALKKNEIKQTLKNGFTYNFEVFENGLYLLEVIASAKSRWQNLRSFLFADHLAITVDGINFPGADGKIFLAPAAWNGNNLKGHLKTVAILVNLSSGSHKINFTTRRYPRLEQINIFKIKSSEFVYTPLIDNPATVGDRRQWLTVVSAGISLAEITIVAMAKKYGNSREDDDIKLVVDGQIIKNDEKKSHRDWFWCGKILKGSSKKFTRRLNFVSPEKHYLALYADASPRLEGIFFSFPFDTSGTVATVVWSTTILRQDPDQNSLALVNDIKEGDTVYVIAKAVSGARPKNNFSVPLNSDRWHKARFGDKIGYIYSEAVEIKGESQIEIKDLIQLRSVALNADTCLMLAIAERESRLFPYAVSASGAQGIFQLMSSAIVEVNKKYDKRFENRFDIQENIEAAILYIKYLQENYAGKISSLEKLLVAWNWGPAHLTAGEKLEFDKLPAETKNFITDVKKIKSECERAGVKKTVVFLSALCLALVFAWHLFNPFPSQSCCVLPKEFADYAISNEISIDVDGDREEEQILSVSNIWKEYSGGETVIFLIKKGQPPAIIFKEYSDLIWLDAGDFNHNGKNELAAFYGYTGSGGFGRFYIHEFSDYGFKEVLFKEDPENTAELIDVDNNGTKEVVYDYAVTKWGERVRGIYDWDDKNNKYVF